MLLMYSLSNPLIYRDFIYAGFKMTDSEMKSLIGFCKHMLMSCQVVFNSEEDANNFIEIYKNFK